MNNYQHELDTGRYSQISGRDTSQRREKEGRKKLKELENKLTPARYESELNYYAKEMPKEIMKIFVTNKLKPMTREAVLKNLKRASNWNAWQGYVCGYKCEDRKIQSQLETMFDDTLRVLAENNYIQFNCYSTVCHYEYRVKNKSF